MIQFDRNESGEIRSGLWTKAEATANSIEYAAIRAKYIQLRFEQLEAQGQHNQIVNEDSESADPEQEREAEPEQVGERFSDERMSQEENILSDSEYILKHIIGETK